MYFEPDIACAFVETKLKHGFSTPYPFWSAKPAVFEPPPVGAGMET